MMTRRREMKFEILTLPEKKLEPKVKATLTLSFDGALQLELDGWYVITINTDGTFKRMAACGVPGIVVDGCGKIVEGG
jgi:hypothetical protein